MHAASDISTLFQPLVVLIFVVVMVMSRIAKKKQQQRQIDTRRSQQSRREESTLEDSGNQERSAEETPGNVEQQPRSTQLQRKLEDIFGELGFPVPQEQPEPQKEPEAAEAEGVVKREIPLETEHKTLEDASVSLETASAEHPYATVKPLSEANIYDTAPQLRPDALSLGTYDPSEMQRLIVWSEVLGKPRALRECDGGGTQI